MKLCSNGSSNATAHVSSNHAEDDYIHQLECLNTSVAEWISQHVQRNPLVDLTPIFRDYETYLNSLDQKRKQLNSERLTKDTKPVSSTTWPIVQAVQTTHTDVTMATAVQAAQTQITISESVGGDHVISGSDHVIPSAVISTTGMIVMYYH